MGGWPMTGLLVRARLILGALAVAGLIAFAAPAHAQQQGSLIDPDASVVNEQTLLRQSPRIEGQTDLLDQRERVLIQPAGRTWDHFHQVTLHWLGAIAILGTLVALAAAYLSNRSTLRRAGSTPAKSWCSGGPSAPAPRFPYPAIFCCSRSTSPTSPGCRSPRRCTASSPSCSSP